MNQIATIAALIQALLPVGQEIASIFVHNPNSQHKMSVILSDVQTISQVASVVATQTNATSTATATH